jgi:hypothetical protein
VTDLFFKYYFDEEDTTFYVQYHDGWVVRQIEISQLDKIFLSEDNPSQGNSRMADQPLEEADMEVLSPITRKEFDKVWHSR